MSAKQTFAKLTEDLEQLEKSEKEKEVTVEEPKAPVAEPETVEPVKEEPVVEEPVKEEDPKEEPKAVDPEVEPKAEPVVEPEVVEPVKEEPVVEPVAEEPKEEPKEEPVSKSEEIDTDDILKAFQAIHKSLGTLPSELAEIKTTLASVVEVVNSLMKEEQVAKSETPTEEPTTEEAEVTEVEEEVAKSAEQPEEEEELDGKAVEFVSKSNGVPEIEGTEPQVEEEVVEPFNPQAHVDKMLRYYEEKSNVLSEGAKDNIRSAVHRIKRGQPTGGDTKLAEQIYNFYEN
ncbi:hypothetical protein BCVP_CDS0026 [Bacillus phage BC-VP]|nr:hypothetical protein BCVP_CDS0026 [Bacillus phage BC-VP]